MGETESKPLSREDLDFLTKHTPFTEESLQEWYQSFLVDCPEGHLTREKFVELYKLFLKSGNPEAYCQHVFRTFDADNNGYIEFKEFCLAVGMLMSGSSEEKLGWAFRMYDINNDGLIEKSEMLKIMQALYDLLGSATDAITDTPEERTEKIFNKVDSNGDGLISQQEFLDGCLEDAQLARWFTGS